VHHTNKYGMRKFINIIENRSFHVPDGRKFVTNDLIDRIISTGQFVPHGDIALYEWWSEVQSGWNVVPEDMREKELDEVRHSSEFRAVFTHWMRDLRAPFVTRQLIQLKPDHELLRAMIVKQAWIDALNEPHSEPIPIGAYWTANGDATPHGARRKGTEIVFMTKLSDVSVDWQHTYESRFDFQNGDMEAEIQLVKGSPIHSVSMDHGDLIHPDNRFTA
jgi:hypothetical protein